MTNRRQFLRQAGAASLLGAPLALSLPALRARAATKQPRLIICTVANGLCRSDRDDWSAQGGDNSLTLPQILSGLEPVKNKVVAFKGLDNLGPTPRKNNGHDPNITTVLRGWNSSGFDGAPATPSFDQFIAKKLGASPFSSIGVSVRGSKKPLFYDDRARRLPLEANPYNVFDRAFAGFSADTGEAEKRARLAKKRSVLDYLGARTSKLSAELSGAERLALEAHLDLIRKAEQSLESLDPAEAAVCTAPTLLGGIVAPNNASTAQLDASMPARGEAMVDLVAAIAACGLSPVIPFALLGDYEQDHYPFLSGVSGSEAKHGFAHGGSQDAYRKINDFWIGFYTDLVRKLDAIPEADGSGSVLDNSIVMLISEMRVGGDHDDKDIPVVLAGGAGGQIRGGRLLKFGGRSLCDLYTSICHAMGAPVDRFGDPSISNGLLPGLLRAS